MSEKIKKRWLKGILNAVAERNKLLEAKGYKLGFRVVKEGVRPMRQEDFRPWR